MLVLVYLYLPVAVLVFYSFNGNRTATVWTEFSFAWYGRILENPSIQTAALNSLLVAGVAAVCAPPLRFWLLLAAVPVRFLGVGRHRGDRHGALILPEIVDCALRPVLFFMAIGVKLGLGAMMASTRRLLHSISPICRYGRGLPTWIDRCRKRRRISMPAASRPSAA